VSLDDLFENFIIVLVVLQFLWSFIKKVLGANKAEEGPLVAFEEDPFAQVNWQVDVRERINEALQHGERLGARLSDLGRSLRGRDVEDLQAIVLHPTRFELDHALAQLRPIAALAEQEHDEAVAELMESGPIVSAAFEAVQVGQLRVAVIEQVAAARQSGQRGYLGDADAVARALIAPLQAFAHAEGVRLPTKRPICTPAGESGQAAIIGLFADHPVIFVPNNFQDELLHWAGVAHEVGHVLWRGVHGLRQEATRITGFSAETAQLPRAQGNQIVFDPALALGAWLEELVCDLLTIMQLGPAGLRGSIHVFADPDDPDDVAWCHTPDGQSFGEHPPRELRIRLNAWTLDRMGFDREAKALLQGWREMHGEQALAIVPTTFGQAIGIPMDVFEKHGRHLLARLLDHRWESLAGRTIESIHGLSMGPGLWARVNERATALAKGQPFNDDGRVVVAAAIEAAAANPGRQLSIGAHARVAIQAIDEGRVEDVHYATSRDRGTESTVLRDAVILADILTRHTRRGIRR
jgi:hypothetical protein